MISCMIVQHRPWLSVEIEECGESMVPLEGPYLFVPDPHPYAALGAPYGEVTPWQLRESVAAALNRAAAALQVIRPGWKLYVHDAFRPNVVQKFMVEHTLEQVAAAAGKNVADLTEEERERMMMEVLSIFAPPSEDPKTPPPHSTGGAVDCTLMDRKGRRVPMGSELDEIGLKGKPDHYIGLPTQQGRVYHSNRMILHDLLHEQGFERHPHEWWHFSMGDQLWAWARREKGERLAVARFGRVEVR